MNEPQKFERLSESEVEIAFSGPAPYVNKTLLHLTGFVARLAFAEVPPPGTAAPHLRTAVTMQLSDLIMLSELIREIVPRHAKEMGIEIVLPQKPEKIDG